MKRQNLKIYLKPNVSNPRMVMGFTGWMDGGDVSTGTLAYMRQRLNASPFAHIEPDEFYIYNFPGSMEVSALFRPHTRIADGIVESVEPPSNQFYCSEDGKVVLLSGKEPNMGWSKYADCIFTVCRELGIDSIYFVGSVAGLTPHTREARIRCSVSDESLKERIQKLGMKMSNYEGPASIVTYLTHKSSELGISMVNLVAEIPAYVQGYNPRCIETAVRVLVNMLELKVPLDDLRQTADEFEKRLDDVVAEQPELAEKISQLELDYDNQIFNNEMGDLKDWLEKKGVRLD